MTESQLVNLIVTSGATGNRFPAVYISGPIAVMEHEHENAGDLLFEIRRLTHHYAVPPGSLHHFQVLPVGA